MVTIISSDKKTVYNVTDTSCTCPDYMFRQSKSGGKCKHMIKYFYTFEQANEVEIKEEIKQFFKGGVQFDVAYNQYGEEVDEWLKKNILCISKHTGRSMFYLLE